MLPEPNQLRIDQISTLMAFASVDKREVQKQAIKLLSMEYDQTAAYLIWQAWAPHISPPEGHPLAGGTKVNDLVIATLLKPFPTAILAKAAAAALIAALAVVITTQTIIDHMVQDLEEEETEMEVTHTSPFHPPAPSGPCCLTTIPTTLSALPTGLAPSRRSRPLVTFYSDTPR